MKYLASTDIKIDILGGELYVIEVKELEFDICFKKKLLKIQMSFLKFEKNSWHFGEVSRRDSNKSKQIKILENNKLVK